MADPESPSTTIHLQNPSPIKRKSFTHSLCKSFSILCIVIFIPFFPSKPPVFINQPILIKFWELIYLSFVGVVLCYGVFSRRNVKVDSENLSDLDNNHNTYFGNPFESSSNNKMIHPWDSEIDSANPDFSIQSGSEFRNPSSRSSDPNCSSQFSTQDSSSSDRSGSSSEDENFIRHSKPQMKDLGYIESAISPLPVPWNLRSQTDRTEMGLYPGAVLGNPRSTHWCDSGGSSSENNFIPGELRFPIVDHNNYLKSKVSPAPIQWNLRTEKSDELDGFRNPKSRTSNCWDTISKSANSCGGSITEFDNSFQNNNILGELDFQKADHDHDEFMESKSVSSVQQNLMHDTNRMQVVDEVGIFHPPLKVVPFSSKEFQSDSPESESDSFSGTDGGVDFQKLEALNTQQKHSSSNLSDGSELALLESRFEMSSLNTESLEEALICPSSFADFEPQNSKNEDLDEKSSDMPSSLTSQDLPNLAKREVEENNRSLSPPEFLNLKIEKGSSVDDLSMDNKEESGDVKKENKMSAFLRGKSVRRIRKQNVDNIVAEKPEVGDSKFEVRDTIAIAESDHNKSEVKRISAKPPKRTNHSKRTLRFLGLAEDDDHSRKGRNKADDVDSVEIDKKAGEFIARFKDQMRCEKVEENEVDRKASEFIAKFKEQIRVEKASKGHH